MPSEHVARAECHSLRPTRGRKYRQALSQELLSPSVEFVLGERIEKFVRDAKLALEKTDWALADRRFRNRNQAHHRLFAACDHYIFATFGRFDQPGEIGLGFWMVVMDTLLAK